MTERGDVLVAIRRVGFGGTTAPERFVLVQDDVLATELATLVVIPLEAGSTDDASDPLSIRVSRAEAGTRQDQSARVSLVGARRRDRFATLPVGRLASATLGAIDEALRVLLALP